MATAKFCRPTSLSARILSPITSPCRWMMLDSTPTSRPPHCPHTLPASSTEHSSTSSTTRAGGDTFKAGCNEPSRSCALSHICNQASISVLLQIRLSHHAIVIIFILHVHLFNATTYHPIRHTLPYPLTKRHYPLYWASIRIVARHDFHDLHFILFRYRGH